MINLLQQLTVRRVLAIVAVLGFIGPNGWFLWQCATDLPSVMQAMQQPLVRALSVEAFGLMLLIAWVIHRSGAKPGASIFIAMSLLGSLIFSIPAWLLAATRASSSNSHSEI